LVVASVAAVRLIVSSVTSASGCTVGTVGCCFNSVRLLLYGWLLLS
jgi:hypothetical protein